MDPNDIQPGIVITGPFWPEPVEVKKSEILEQDIQINVVRIPSGEHFDKILSIWFFVLVKEKWIVLQLKLENWALIAKKILSSVSPVESEIR